MKTCLRLLFMLLVLLFCNMASADTNIFVGGSADGYDKIDGAGNIGWPVIDNAGGATGVTTNSAWLNGTLLATGGAPTTVYLYWGDEDGTNNHAAWANTNDFGVRTKGALTTNLTGLTANTRYYYRFYATNEDAEVWASPSETFKTYDQPAVNNGQGADPVGEITARLNGRLTAGISAQVYIYWGQDTNNWSRTNNVGQVAEGYFSTTIGGLTPGTNYYYRCYATNTYGEDWADSATNFMTLDEYVLFIGGDADGYDGIYTNTVVETGAPVGTFFMIQ